MFEPHTRTCKKCNTVLDFKNFKKKSRICKTCKENILSTIKLNHKKDLTIKKCELCLVEKETYKFYIMSKKCKDCSHKLDSKSKKQERLREKNCSNCDKTKDIKFFRYKKNICIDCEKGF